MLHLLESTDLPTIDLHECRDVQSAIEQLEQKLFSFYSNNAYCVRVIHGIGTGVLAQAVHDILKKNPLVVEWEEEGNGGSCVVSF